MNARHPIPSLRRILVVDDNAGIHEDFRRIFDVKPTDSLAQEEEALFGSPVVERADVPEQRFEITSVLQGEPALELVRKSVAEGNRFHVAFVDMRMPPGWNGVETIKRLWQVDPLLEVVLCTAYSDYTWQELTTELGATDRFLVLKKPFESVEVRQLAMSLSEKNEWNESRECRLSELEDAVRKRTQELQTALSAAQAADRSKSEFLANVSHEIRTPMTAVLGFTDMLLDELNVDAGNPRAVEAVKVIRRNGDHLLGLINDILDLCKVEAGMFTVDEEVCSPRQVVNETMELLRGRAEDKGLTLQLQLEEPVCDAVQTDAKRLKQILVNLIGNAIKFTDAGQVSVTLRHSAELQPRLEFDITDTGIGISGEQRNKLFQPFTQGDTSITRRFGGTGLGLTISKRLARLLDGDVELVKSFPGEGSTFRLKLPLKQVAPGSAGTTAARPEAVASQVARINVAADAINPLEGIHILLAEDGQDNQALIMHMLRKAGAKVTLAENGKLALDKVRLSFVRGDKYDLVLMDMQMPIMDGYEATSILRSEGYDLPIIALTAQAMTGDREKCLAAGCSDYTTKPIRKAELINTIVSHYTAALQVSQ
ncbi:MAG: response regulator [Pirellulales bacterium]